MCTWVGLCLVIGQADNIIALVQVLLYHVKVFQVAHDRDIKIDQVPHIILQQAENFLLDNERCLAPYLACRFMLTLRMHRG